MVNCYLDTRYSTYYVINKPAHLMHLGVVKIATTKMTTLTLYHRIYLFGYIPCATDCSFLATF